MESKEAQRLLEAEAMAHREAIRTAAILMSAGDHARADDLTQETFLRAFKSASQYLAGTNCKAWLLTILRSVFIDGCRADRRRGEHQELPQEIEGPEPVDADEDPMETVEGEVRQSLLNLPRIHREVLILVVMGGLGTQEAARILGIPPGTVKSRVYDGCRQLQKSLGKYAADRRIAQKKKKRR